MKALFASLFLLAACAANPYSGILPGTSPTNPALQDEVRRAMAGDKQAQLALGIRYESGSGVPVDYEKAELFYREAAADSGGTLWVYSPPVSKNDQGRVLPIDRGAKIAGLEEAKRRLAGLRARIIEKEGYR